MNHRARSLSIFLPSRIGVEHTYRHFYSKNQCLYIYSNDNSCYTQPHKCCQNPTLATTTCLTCCSSQRQISNCQQLNYHESGDRLEGIPGSNLYIFTRKKSAVCELMTQKYEKGAEAEFAQNRDVRKT